MQDTPRRPLIARIALTLVGGLLFGVGVVGLMVPIMPGWPLIVPGLAILAGEYVWARRLLDETRRRIDIIRGVKDQGGRRAA